MNLPTRYFPSWVKRPIRQAMDRLTQCLWPAPEEVVKANTARAFDYFWNHRNYVQRQYLTPIRQEMYVRLACQAMALLGQNPPPDRPWQVMDVGCGPGHFLQAMSGQSRSCGRVDWHGIDFSKAAVQQAKRLFPQGRFHVQDICRPTSIVQAFDLVTCLETLEHLDEPSLALDHLVRWTRPGGHLLMAVPNGEHDRWDGHRQFWTQATFGQWLEPHGSVSVQRVIDDTVLLAHLRIPKTEAQVMGTSHRFMAA